MQGVLRVWLLADSAAHARTMFRVEWLWAGTAGVCMGRQLRGLRMCRFACFGVPGSEADPCGVDVRGVCAEQQCALIRCGECVALLHTLSTTQPRAWPCERTTDATTVTIAVANLSTQAPPAAPASTTQRAQTATVSTAGAILLCLCSCNCIICRINTAGAVRTLLLLLLQALVRGLPQTGRQGDARLLALQRAHHDLVRALQGRCCHRRTASAVQHGASAASMALLWVCVVARGCGSVCSCKGGRDADWVQAGRCCCGGVAAVTPAAAAMANSHMRAAWPAAADADVWRVRPRASCRTHGGTDAAKGGRRCRRLGCRPPQAAAAAAGCAGLRSVRAWRAAAAAGASTARAAACDHASSAASCWWRRRCRQCRRRRTWQRPTGGRTGDAALAGSAWADAAAHADAGACAARVAQSALHRRRPANAGLTPRRRRC
jgi:hypothetical protein